MTNWFFKWWHAIQGLFYLDFCYYFVQVMVEIASIIFSLVLLPSKFSAKSISWPLKRSQKQTDHASLSLFCFVAALLISKYVRAWTKSHEIGQDEAQEKRGISIFIVLPSSLNKQNVAKDKRQVGDNQWNCRAENIHLTLESKQNREINQWNSTNRR